MTGDLTTLGVWQRINNTVYILHERQARHGRMVKCNKVMFSVGFDIDEEVPKHEQERLLNEIVKKLNAVQP
jgi:hypothetical protein